MSNKTKGTLQLVGAAIVILLGILSCPFIVVFAGILVALICSIVNYILRRRECRRAGQNVGIAETGTIFLLAFLNVYCLWVVIVIIVNLIAYFTHA